MFNFAVKRGYRRNNPCNVVEALTPPRASPSIFTVRQTAASYWLALDGNPVHIAEQLGHSVDQLKTHDKALVKRTDAERFWRLIPKSENSASCGGPAVDQPRSK